MLDERRRTMVLSVKVYNTMMGMFCLPEARARSRLQIPGNGGMYLIHFMDQPVRNSRNILMKGSKQIYEEDNKAFLQYAAGSGNGAESGSHHCLGSPS